MHFCCHVKKSRKFYGAEDLLCKKEQAFWRKTIRSKLQPWISFAEVWYVPFQHKQKETSPGIRRQPYCPADFVWHCTYIGKFMHKSHLCILHSMAAKFSLVNHLPVSLGLYTRVFPYILQNDLHSMCGTTACQNTPLPLTAPR